MGQKIRRYATFGLGFNELLFYGGLIYGWATLVYVLKTDGYYSHLCEQNETTTEVPTSNNTPPTCDEQDAILNLVFTVGAFSLQGSLFFTGVLFDYFGTRFLRLLLHLLLVSGLVMMAFSSPSLSVLIFPGMVCIAIGGIQILFTNNQIGNLFGSRKATVMTLLNGCLDSSSFIMLLIKVGYEGGISLQISFAILAGATLFFFINTFVFLPKHHIPWPLPPEYGIKINSKKDDIDFAGNVDENTNQHADGNIEEIGLNESNNVDVSRQLAETYRNKDFPTLKSCICSPIYFLFVMWLSILLLRLLFFLGTLNSYLVQLTDGNEKLVSQYTTIFGFFQICGVLVAPFSGMILDRNKSKQSNTIRGPYEDLGDSALAFAVTTIFYIVFSISNTIPVLEVLYVTFLLHIITRGFMFGLAAAAIPIIFPGQYFGSLYGLLLGLSSIVGLLQFPLFIASQKFFDDDPLVINLILMVACMFTIALPIYIHFYAKQKNNEVALHTEKEGVDNPVVVADS